MLARSPLFEKFSLQRNFQGLLSIVQLSRFLSFFLCDSFDILSNLFRFVKNFFILLFCPLRFPLGPLQATACIDYHISSALSTTFFHLFFSALPAPLFRSPHSGRSASASPAVLLCCGLKVLSSATGAILSPQKGIVNVFSIFYLFQTIHTILTLSHSQNKRLEIWSSLHWTYHIYFCFLIVITLVTAFSHTPNRSDLPHDTTTFPLFHAG